MSVEPVPADDGRSCDLRADRPERRLDSSRRSLAWVAFVALASGFVLVGGGSLDLGRDRVEARAGGGRGDRAVRPGLRRLGAVALARAGRAEPGSGPGPRGGRRRPPPVRWPSAIAGVLDRPDPDPAGFERARAAGRRAGRGLLVRQRGPDRSLGGGRARPDRRAWRPSRRSTGSSAGAPTSSRGSGRAWPSWRRAGPPLVLIVAGDGRHRPARGGALGPPRSLPPLAAAAAWSAWALSVAPAEAWGAALALPLDAEIGVVRWPSGSSLLGLPWSPFAALVASRSVREGWSADGRALVLGWLQVAAACLVVGTVVPGLASAARVPALAGLAVVAAACCDRAWAGSVSTAARRAFLDPVPDDRRPLGRPRDRRRHRTWPAPSPTTAASPSC